MKRLNILCAGTALVVASLAGTAAHADDDSWHMGPSVQVAGQCYEQVAPDRARIMATAEFTHPSDAQQASKMAVDAYNEALKQIKKMDLKDAQYNTVNYNLNKHYEYADKRQVFKGYKATIGIQVETSEIGRIGDVIAKATNTGLKNVSGLSTYVSQLRLNDVHAACYEKAVMDAKKKAQRMVSAAGANLGRVLTIGFNQTSNPYPMPQPMAMRGMAMMESADAAMAAPAIEAGLNDVRMTVNVVFAIE